MIPILYLDNAILVCVNPAGILSQGAPEGGTDLPVLLSRQCGGQVYPIHRLDRGVGGVMVYARTKPAAGALSRAVQLGALKKEYLCIVSGGPEAAEGIYRDLLFHDSTRNKTFVVQRLRKGVKEASLSYRVLDTSGNRSLVRIQLHTGRTHQIRVQFASRGMPLLGDRKYLLSPSGHRRSSELSAVPSGDCLAEFSQGRLCVHWIMKTRTPHKAPLLWERRFIRFFFIKSGVLSVPPSDSGTHPP